jgi:small subunit ribosomal protein S20
MAHSRSNKKRVRQNETHRKHNRAIKTRYRSQMKKVLALISAKGDGIAKEFNQLCSWLDKAAAKRVIHRNAAARTKARVAARIAAASTKK